MVGWVPEGLFDDGMSYGVDVAIAVWGWNGK